MAQNSLTSPLLPLALLSLLSSSPALAQTTDTTGTWENNSTDLLDNSNEGSMNPYDFMHRLQMMRDVDGFYERKDRQLDNAAASFLERQQQMLQGSTSAEPNLLQILPGTAAPTAEILVTPDRPNTGMDPQTILDRLNDDTPNSLTPDPSLNTEPVLTIEPATPE